ncbi:hypothetical protein ACSC1U_11975 [Mammaliicoccus lentus]
MVNSKFDSDLKKEFIIGEFLDKYFYPKMIEKYPDLIEDIQRNDDINKQYQGIDIMIKVNEEKTINVDEKAATQYINKNIPTFSLEIASYNKEEYLKMAGYLVINIVKLILIYCVGLGRRIKLTI